MISVPNPVKIIVHHDQLNIQTIIVNSPIIFGRGGNAKFASVNESHQIAIKGKMICNPRVRYIIRL